MFLPIIHNLTPNCAGYKEAQAYNAIIGKKPKAGVSLSEKRLLQSIWMLDCQIALEKAKGAIVCKA